MIKLLQLAADAIETLREGKTGCPLTTEDKTTFNSTATRPKFTEQTKAYYTTLEETSVEIRKEIRLLNDASGSKVMPISVVPKASGVGRVKEEQIWQSISEAYTGNGIEHQSNTNNTADQMDIDVNEQINQEPSLGGLQVSTNQDDLAKIQVITK